MSTCPVFLINLDRSPDRLAAMSEQLDRLGLDWTRVPAVDSASFGPLPWPDFDHEAFDRNLGKAPNPGELGCYLSHVKAMRTMLAGGADTALILEDDAVLGADFPALLADLLARRAEWDMVKLSGFHDGLPKTNAVLATGHRLVSFLASSRSSAAYLLTREAAEKYLARLLPMSVPYDHAFDQAWVYGLRVRGVQPYPVRIGSFRSLIEPTSMGGKKPWHRRSTVLSYRLGVVTRRILHHLVTDRAWMSSRD